MKNNFQVDTREYGFTEVPRLKYVFKAICTSDLCRLVSTSNEDRTDVGAVKKVPRSTVFCHQCDHALLWIKEIAA